MRLAYRAFARYLMPQWNGEDGEAAKFAAEVTDRIGGDAGDILYFQVASEITCACNQPEFMRLSWARLQKGHDLLEREIRRVVYQ